MVSNKPLQIFIAMFVALGLFLSPFSMKHGFAAPNSPESSVVHCLENSDKMSVKETNIASGHHKKSSDGQSKNKGGCCVAACAALIVVETTVNFVAPAVKSAIVMSYAAPLFGKSNDGLARPPKSLS